MIRFSLGITVLFCLLLIEGVWGNPLRREVRVAAPSASVYDVPRATGHIIGRLPRGASLYATGRVNGDWMEVEAPVSVSGWIYGELLREDRVSVSSVKIRSGPGVEYGELGILQRGDAVRVRRKEEGGWVEFEGMPAMTVWVERSMVSSPAVVQLAEEAPVTPTEPVPERDRVASVPVPEPPVQPPERVVVPEVAPVRAAVHPEPAPSTRPSPAVVQAARPVSPPVRSEPAASASGSTSMDARPRSGRARAHGSVPNGQFREPAHSFAPASIRPWSEAGFSPGWRPVRAAPQGEPVRVEGIVRPTGFGLLLPAGYRLVPADSIVPAQTIFFLHGESALLSRSLGRRVIVEGHRYWLIGVREPVIAVSHLR